MNGRSATSRSSIDLRNPTARRAAALAQRDASEPAHGAARANQE
jgi:hypothetical protein